MRTLLALTRRDLLVFFRDRMTVFFAFLTPLIVLLLYILFLGQVQINSLESNFQNIPGISSLMIKKLVDSWFLSSVLAVGSISGAVSGAQIIVQDRVKKVDNDFLIAPVKPAIVTLAYFINAFLISLMIELVVLGAISLYLLSRGTLDLSFINLLILLGLILLGSLSAVLFIMPAAHIFKSEAAFGGFIGIASSLSGFLLGAYMPPSMFPSAIQYFISFIPGAHIAALMRSTLMTPPLEAMAPYIGNEAVSSIKDSFSFQLNFFGKTVSILASYLYVSAMIIVTLIICLFIFRHQRKKAI